MNIQSELIESIQIPESAPAKKFLELLQEKENSLHVLTFTELVNKRIFATFKVGEDSEGDIEAILVVDPGKKGLSISTAHSYLCLDSEGNIECNVEGSTVQAPFPFDTDEETYFGMITLHDYKDIAYEHIGLFRELVSINDVITKEFYDIE